MRAIKEHGSGSAVTDLGSAFKKKYDVFYDAFGEDIIAHGKAWVDAEIKTAIRRARACARLSDRTRQDRPVSTLLVPVVPSTPVETRRKARSRVTIGRATMR
jgi:hypothetical protein